MRAALPWGAADASLSSSRSWSMLVGYAPSAALHRGTDLGDISQGAVLRTRQHAEPATPAAPRTSTLAISRQLWGAHSCMTLRVTQISRQSDGAAGIKCRNERKRVEFISSRGSRAGNTPASLDHGPAQGTLVLLAHRLQHEAPHLIAEQCLQQEGVRACSPTCILLNGETPPLCAVRTCTSSRSYHRSTFTAPCQT